MSKEIPLNEHTAKLLDVAVKEVKMTPEFLVELALRRFLWKYKAI